MPGASTPLRIGVLALQGGFAAHRRVLTSLGAVTSEVRRPAELSGLDALVVPGGESTTISMGLEDSGLGEAIRELAGRGTPVLGTCAGLILCDDAHLGLLDVTARRNAYGRQLQSFEADLCVAGLGDEALRAVFIRAPRVERWAPDVEILARWNGEPVAVRQGGVVATAFHPELTEDPRFHALFMAIATAARERGPVAGEATR